MIRLLASLVLVVMTSSATAVQESPAGPGADVAQGVRQVEEGDFEAAVTTLEAAAGRLRGDPRHVHLLVQADIQLGVAHTALDHREAAVQAFTEAVTLDPRLRLDPERYSPKVRQAFDTARLEAQRRTGAPARKSHAKTAWLLAGGAAVAAGTVIAATHGAGTDAPSFNGARFGTPALLCPNGFDDVPLPVTILVEASNPSGEPLAITSVSTVLRIEASPGFPVEVGFASNLPSMVAPAAVPAKGKATLQVTTSILCGNGEGDPGRFNEWSGSATFTTAAGVFAANTIDRMRVNLP